LRDDATRGCDVSRACGIRWQNMAMPRARAALTTYSVAARSAQQNTHGARTSAVARRCRKARHAGATGVTLALMARTPAYT